MRKYKTPCAEVIQKTSAVLNLPPEKCINQEAGVQQSTSAPVEANEQESGNAENIPVKEKSVMKRGASRKRELVQKLSDTTNTIRPTESMFFF